MSYLSNAFSKEHRHQWSRRRFIQSASLCPLTLGPLSALDMICHSGFVSFSEPERASEVKIRLTSQKVGCINNEFLGFSHEKNDVSSTLFTGDNRSLIGLYRRLGNGVLRIGGNQVDRTKWRRSGAGRITGEVAPSDLDRLAAFARETNWKVLYGVNLAQSSPALAADEVSHAIQALGGSLLGIEVGNEPDCFEGLNYVPKSWQYENYFARWSAFANSILQRSPHCVLTGPASGYRLDWFKSFASDAPRAVRLLTHHYYRANGKLPTSNVSHLISYPDSNLTKQLEQIRDAAAGANLPFRIAETNSYYNGGSSKVSSSYASALWAIDYLFTLASYGCSGANFHGGGNGDGYTPIADIRGTVIGPRPEYYGMYLFSLAGTGDVYRCDIESGGYDMTAYAVKTAIGGAKIVIVNKMSKHLSITINLLEVGRWGALKARTFTEMTNTSLSATTGTLIEGSAINVDGGINAGKRKVLSLANNDLQFSVSPVSASLIELN